MAEHVAYRSAQGRWVLFATILGSGMAQLDGTIVNVALPRIGEDLDAGLTSLQWTVNAYSLLLSGLLLLGGSLGDRLGGAASSSSASSGSPSPRPVARLHRRPRCSSRCALCRASARRC